MTGQYGTILPLDFNKTQIRRNQIEALSLDTPRGTLPDEGVHCNSDEEELRQSMDLHQMISENISLNHETQPVSADQVIEEIDEMMHVSDKKRKAKMSSAFIFQTHDLMRSMTTDRTGESDSFYSSVRSPFTASQAETDFKHHEPISFTWSELSNMSHSKLLALTTEMEQLILLHNSELVAELAHRDELEYEKEVKNKFITLLVNIQDQRRKFHAERKKNQTAKPIDISQLPQCVTATIPFDETQRSVNVCQLEALIKSRFVRFVPNQVNF